MNTYTLNLSSPTTSYIKHNPQLELDDMTRLVLDVSRLNERVLPIYLKIDWGFGETFLYDNNVYRTGSNQINIVRYSPLLTDTYPYVYYPSETALFKSLSAQVLVRYSDGTTTWFVIPIRIRTYGYSESVGDLTLINTNILPVEDNLSEHQLKTSVDSYIIELRGD